MLNAVDINQFLAQAQYQSQDTSLDQLLSQTMAGIVHSDVQVVAQKEVDRRLGMYCMGLTKQTIGLFDTGHGKKFLFEFDVLSGRVSMNQRRAQAKEIKFFSHRLNQLAQIGPQVVHLFGVHSTAPNDDSIEVLPQPLLKKLSGIFHFQLPLSWQVLSKQQFNGLGRLFNAIVNKCKVSLTESDATEQMTQLFSYVEGVIGSQSLGADDCVLVTNSHALNASMNVVYSMYVYVASIIIVTEKGSDKSTIEIDTGQKVATLDGEQLKANAVGWLLSKCQKISADISSGVAMVYESIE